MGILAGLVIAITGTLPAEPCNIKKWVEANGGRWSARVGNHVTHLITGKDAWKKVTHPVMQAAELNIFIVSYDWFEDSLQGKRKLAEKKYTWEMIKRDRKRRREIKKLGAAADGTSQKLPTERKAKPSTSHFFAASINTKFVSATDDLKRRRAEREAAEAAEKAAKAAKKAWLQSSGIAQAPINIEDEYPASGSMPTPPASVSPVRAIPSKDLSAPLTAKATAEPQAKKPTLKDLYHYYLDSTGFEYKVTLARSNFALNSITRYQISILESHTTPHTYCTFAQYTPPAGSRPEDSSSGSSKTPVTSLRNPLLNFLKHANATAKKDEASAQPPKPQPEAAPQHDEATRLRSLITAPTPTLTTPYKSLLTPLSSPFPTAWRAFRHVFRDLTLLSWEERFDVNKTIQKARARALQIEPYLYAKPPMGMPLGLMVQESGLGQGFGASVTIVGDAVDGYRRNEWGLPGMSEVLGRGGVVGSAIWRDEQDAREKEEKAKRGEDEREDAERKRKGLEKPKKQSYRGPLFNGANGRPTEGYGGSDGACGGAGSGAQGYVRNVSRNKRYWGYDE
ncbi:hypothetical protein CC86DRAFT_96262 [Ophiobolus disseminans]|uniref:BRCT domain-containing protein n=1 Tax=Ophiobolus disseminans TaxID=1469910 RepID=A0A6A6ZM16_9PLEO|nr:hypothetical protein CC86DRAFT_96262 [Ophiobolus disseminans]